MRDVLIGIDAGTSVIKAVAFDLSGRQFATHAMANRYAMMEGGGCEQDVARTWTDTTVVLRGLADKVPDLAARTAALAVTGQGDGTWLLDRAGAPVAPAWLWLDARSADIVDDFRNGPDDARRFAITGTGLAACQQAPQLLWMKRHAPHMLERAATAMHCKDWLYFNLTGELVTDPSEGTFTYGNFRSRSYDDEVSALLGLAAEKRRCRVWWTARATMRP